MKVPVLRRMVSGRLLRAGIALVLAAGGASVATVAAATPASAAGCVQHHFEVQTSPLAHHKWSVYGDLYAGNGSKVHHWQETDKKAGRDYVWWNFTCCGHHGLGDIWIYPSPNQKYSYLNLSLDRDYCWRIGVPDLGWFSQVDDC